MNNLHSISSKQYSDVQKAYAVYWDKDWVRFGDEYTFHHSADGIYWVKEYLRETVWEYLLGEWARRGKPEPDYSKMSRI